MQYAEGLDEKNNKYEFYYLEDLSIIFIFKEEKGKMDDNPRYRMTVRKGGEDIWCPCPGNVNHQHCRHLDFVKDTSGFDFTKKMKPKTFKQETMDAFIRNWWSNLQKKGKSYEERKSA